MSRVAKKVIDVPAGVTVTLGADLITVKGAKGALSLAVAAGVAVAQENKLDMVLDKRNAGLLFMDPKMDITDKVRSKFGN